MRFQPHPVFGFVTRAQQRLSVLQNQVFISEAYNPASGTPEPSRKEYVCIWDTGATGTVIRKKIADDLGLKPSGKCSVHAVGQGDQAHEYEANTYLVNLYLPNNVIIMGARVVEGAIAGGDLLIGMDVIGEGDFAVTNCNGRTCWTFRMPSVEEIDFVPDADENNRRLRTGNPSNRNQEQQRRMRQMLKQQEKKNKGR